MLWKVFDTYEHYSDFVEDKKQVGLIIEGWAELTREIWTW